METVDYSLVLRQAVDLFGEDADNLETVLEKKFRGWISRRLRTAWEFYFWPELLLLENRFYHADYVAATAYAAKNFVYYPDDQEYYVALRASTGNLPTSTAYWAKAATSYAADDYSATKAYVAGNQVYYKTTAKFYGCHTAGTANLPTNTSFWGELVELNQYVPYEQTGKTKFSPTSIFHAWDKDPKHRYDALEVGWWLSADGVQVKSSVKHIWIEFRKRPPTLKGDKFDSAKAYAIGDQIRFDGAVSNFYDALAATTAGQSPTTDAAKWSVVEIPKIFEHYLAQGAFSDALKSEGANEKFFAEERVARELLGDQVDVIAGQSGQIQRVAILRR